VSFTKTTGANKQALVSRERGSMLTAPASLPPCTNPACFAVFPFFSYPTKLPPDLRNRLNEANEANPCPDTLERPPHPHYEYTPASRGIGRSNHAWGSMLTAPAPIQQPRSTMFALQQLRTGFLRSSSQASTLSATRGAAGVSKKEPPAAAAGPGSIIGSSSVTRSLTVCSQCICTYSPHPPPWSGHSFPNFLPIGTCTHSLHPPWFHLADTARHGTRRVSMTCRAISARPCIAADKVKLDVIAIAAKESGVTQKVAGPHPASSTHPHLSRAFPNPT
jgi:hypothetical protein